ncbi:MAG: hypothetical protein V3T65_07860 [Acidobacteriota bacterium]
MDSLPALEPDAGCQTRCSISRLMVYLLARPCSQQKAGCLALTADLMSDEEKFVPVPDC